MMKSCEAPPFPNRYRVAASPLSFPMPNDINPPFGTVPSDAESFRPLPLDAETVGSVPNGAAGFGNVPHTASRTHNHTLTVREVARMFEAAGVGRTERSIVNWCRRDAAGVARLDSYYDPNDRRYYITPQSVALAIAEEQAKVARNSAVPETAASPSAPAEPRKRSADHAPAVDDSRLKALEQEVLDLTITNKAKDYFIEQLKAERSTFATERQDFVERLLAVTRRVGELETRLLQAGQPGDSDQPETDSAV